MASADIYPHFDLIDTKVGLSQDWVETITQDADGYIWLGTQDGLNRYDGYDVRVFGHDPNNPASLSSSWIRSVLAGSDGALWVGAEDGGLNRLDPKSGEVTYFAFDPEDPNTMIPGAVRAIVEDAAGRLWIGSAGGGVALLDRATGRATRYGVPQGLTNLQVRSLVAHADGLWIGTDGGGVYHRDADTGEIAHVAWARDERVRSMALDDADHLWVGTYEKGLIRVQTKTGEVVRYRHEPDVAHSLSSDSTRAIFLDEQNRVWVGTDGSGLNVFDPATGRFQRFLHDPNRPGSLSSDYVGALFIDRGGVLWVATYGGANKWNPNMGGFRSFARFEDAPDALSSNFVLSVAKTGEDQAWVGTGAGLNLLDMKTGTAKHYRHDPGDDRTISDDRVYSLLADGAAMWIGTKHGGLNRLDTTTGAIKHYRHDPNDPRSLGSNDVTAIMRSSTGDLWLGSFGGGVSRMLASESRFRRYTHDPMDPSSVGSNSIMQIVEDSSGTIWLATYDGGLSRYTGNGRFQTLRENPDDPRTLSSDSAWLVHEDAAGNLWVGTSDAGLNMWSAADRRAGIQRFMRLGVNQGLPSWGVYGLISDKEGGVWTSSSRGLTHLNVDTGKFTTYDTSHGLLGNEFNWGAFHRAPDGQLLFGGTAGLNTFYPSELDINRHPPDLVATGFSVMNERMDVARLLDDKGVVQLGHDDLLFTFEYAALDYTAPKKHQYQHRMLGFDDVWVDDGPIRRATYTNLDAGLYEFQVRASNGDGVWNQSNLAIPVFVSPAPWASWWARSIYAFITLLIGYGLYRDQRRRAMKAHELRVANEALRAEIEERHAQQRAMQELERRVSEAEKMEALGTLSRGIAHDFNNILSAIMGYAELSLLRVAENSEVARYLRQMETSTERARELVHSILTFSRQARQDPKPCDFIGVVQGVLQIVEPSLPANVRMTVTMEDDVSPVMADPAQLNQLVLNLLTNAYQAIGPAGGTVQVVIKNLRSIEGAVSGGDPTDEDASATDAAKPLVDYVEFKVRDTGSGMDGATQDRVFNPFFTTKDRQEGTGLGLSVVHGIVTQLGGQVSVESELGVGSEFTILLPACEESPDVIVPITQHPTKLQGGDETILFVDDERSIVTITREMLTKLGYKVLTAGDGDTALVQFKALAGGVDLVVTDQKMPRMLGSDLAKQIREIDPNVPIVLASGDGAEHAQDAAVSLFLHKPFTQEELASCIRRALNSPALSDTGG